MFKRKCHDIGDAIQVSGGLLILCRCVTAKEINMLLKLAEGQNKDV